MSDVKSPMILFFCTMLLTIPSILLADTVQYQYDAAGRLTGATYDDGSRIGYSYDAAGNRITKTVTPGVVCPSDLDGDHDVDGTDLALFVSGGGSITVEEFAGDFGKINCPQ